jgi:hypothetical protein
VSYHRPAASGANNRGLVTEFGVRSETNVFVDKNKHAHVTGGELQMIPLF